MLDHASADTVDRVVGMRLRQFQHLTGLPVVFGGATTGHRTGRRLCIGHVRGALGTGLVDLTVQEGRGLGGSAIAASSLRRVDDYASTRAITHDFDGIVVEQERISSIFALPVTVDRVVHAVVYGAVRGPHRIGDVVLERAARFGKSLQDELQLLLAAPVIDLGRQPALRHTRAAIAELSELASRAPAGARQSSIHQLVAALQQLVTDEREPVADAPPAPRLAPREVDVLRLVSLGMSNSEVAAPLGLTTETVRSYLRNAMRKLGARNRTEAVHIARGAGAI